MILKSTNYLVVCRNLQVSQLFAFFLHSEHALFQTQCAAQINLHVAFFFVSFALKAKTAKRIPAAEHANDFVAR